MVAAIAADSAAPESPGVSTEHVGIDHEAVTGQAPAQRLDEPTAGYPYLGDLTAGRVR